ncbi:hypothetical protein SAMN04515695_3416 [Pseudovibrio sp. Tun.PSC04-5.I4]|nr:hypothetical protein SAMN04515695_3416 [Pseudovibrio sp. Tun.PSC04-5.I4]
MTSFKGTHYSKDVILHAVFFSDRYSVSYRDLEKIMLERRVEVLNTGNFFLSFKSAHPDNIGLLRSFFNRTYWFHESFLFWLVLTR